MIEILAPAGNIETAKIAINHGCDAIYLGGKNFGARALATNFTNEEIIEIINYAHSMNVLVYVTVNTIIKAKEMEEALAFIAFLNDAHCDAIIIQDLGLVEKVHKIFPNLSLHASTQMSINTLSEAKNLALLGFKRVILAREVSIDVIGEIVKNVDIEVEVFVHGAICMSYSGNCYMSSFIGKRSGNRGRCAQPCRLAYKLLDVTDNEYLLSPKDLNTLNRVEELKEAGVTAFKIEGRMKRPEYVGLCVKSYREALKGRNITHNNHNLALMFNRKFTEGFIFNEKNADFTNTQSANHIGLNVGKVIKSSKNYAHILLSDNLSIGDSIRFSNDAITINEMYVNGLKKSFGKAKEIVQVHTHTQVQTGDAVLKTTDINLISSIKSVSNKQIPLQATLNNEAGYAKLTVSDGVNEVIVRSSKEVELARNPEMRNRLREQLEKTNNSIYCFTKITIQDNLFLTIKDINEMRREALALMTKKRIKRDDNVVQNYSFKPVNIIQTKKMFVKVRTMNQLMQALNAGMQDILVEDKSFFSLKEQWPNVNFYLLEERVNTTNNNYDAISTLNYLGEHKILSSPYMNIINHNAIYFMHSKGINTVGLSIEASREDIKASINKYKEEYNVMPNVMVMVYGYYELMLMKHCLINKALGLNQKGCMQCVKKQYYLEDRMKYKFPLIRDNACNLKMLNSKVLHLLPYIKELLSIGVNNILLDFSIEENITEILIAYKNSFFDDEQINLALDDATYGHYKEEML